MHTCYWNNITANDAMWCHGWLDLDAAAATSQVTNMSHWLHIFVIAVSYRMWITLPSILSDHLSGTASNVSDSNSYTSHYS